MVRGEVVPLLLLAAVVADASLCVVSKWRAWSACVGTCEYAVRVRNRDVLKPPLPERDEKSGALVRRVCPALYETRKCTLLECQEESPFVRPVPQDEFVVGFAHQAQQRFPEPLNIKLTRPTCAGLPHGSCCRVVRPTCPNGNKPKKVIKWYRLPNEKFCRPYTYPHCGPIVEGVENPLDSEKACVQSCFSHAEMNVFPDFRPL